jgi:hydrogenase expression/formation protein HypC
MCLGIPGRVVAMVEGYSDQLALVEVEGVARRVNIGLLDAGSVRLGDCVLIHMGFALERVDEEKATQARLGLELMGRGVDQQ